MGLPFGSMSTSEIASILDNSKELDRLRKEQEEVLSDINKIHKKLQTSVFFSLCDFNYSIFFTY